MALQSCATKKEGLGKKGTQVTPVLLTVPNSDTYLTSSCFVVSLGFRYPVDENRACSSASVRSREGIRCRFAY